MILAFFMCANAFWHEDRISDITSIASNGFSFKFISSPTLKCDRVYSFTSKNNTINVKTKDSKVLIGDQQISSGTVCFKIASFNRGFIVKQQTAKDWKDTCDAITFEIKGRKDGVKDKHVTCMDDKHDIGAIKIHPEISYFEILPLQNFRREDIL